MTREKEPTPKQRKFAECIVSGMNPSEAYREAYDATRMRDATVAVEAQKTLSIGKVSKLIEEGRKSALSASAWTFSKMEQQLEHMNAELFGMLEDEGFSRPVFSAWLQTVDRLNRVNGTVSEADRRRDEAADAARAVRNGALPLNVPTFEPNF